LWGSRLRPTPPTPQANWLYAAAAAQMSIVLEKYDPARAKAYRDSAIRAMEWAAKNSKCLTYMAMQRSMKTGARSICIA
jgi:hypothetical protein